MSIASPAHGGNLNFQGGTDLASVRGLRLLPHGSAAFAVNGLGHVVGNSHLSNGNPRATLWRDGQIIDLTPDVAPYESSSASGMNDAGKWIGAVQVEEMPPWHGFVAQGFTRTPLGHLGGGRSFPNDINSTGPLS